jgi:UDP-GlcNAc:undecaprenyl-phosphate GlcNAc-1-phosphate transferase
MGDCGSLFIGFLLAATSLQAPRQGAAAVPLLVPIVLLGLPIADTLLSMARRKLRGVPMFAADRGHIHHRLLARGLGHRDTVLVLYVLAACLAATAIVLVRGSDLEAVLVLALLAAVGYVVLRLLGFFDAKKLPDVLEQRRRNLALREAMEEVAARLREVDEHEQLLEPLADAAPVLGADRVVLKLAANGEEVEYASTPAPVVAGACARFPLRSERREAGVLEFRLPGGSTGLDRDTEIAIERLCAHLSSAVDRIDAKRARSGGPGGTPPPRVADLVPFRRGKRA